MSASKRPRLADDASDDSDAESSASSATMHRRFDDVVAGEIDEAAQFGVSWQHFVKGEEVENRKMAWRTILKFAESEETRRFYIGVCKSPAHRFFKKPAPHKFKFDVLYPLLVGRDMGKVEKNMLQVIRKGQVALGKLENVGPGGEGVHRKSIRFLYLCVSSENRSS